jgi:hypothetical protein
MVWCELVLAFRSLATVAVFLRTRERRAEFLNVRKTCGLLLGRTQLCRQSPDDTAPFDEELETWSFHANVSDTTWQIGESDVQLDVELGAGVFGAVWAGWWGNHRVAVKVLRGGRRDEEGDCLDHSADKDLQSECAVLQQLNHPHLIKFWGYGTTATGNGFIVTELMELGSLRGILSDPSQEVLWHTRVSIGLQCALGMEHLHKIAIVRVSPSSSSFVTI